VLCEGGLEQKLPPMLGAIAVTTMMTETGAGTYLANISTSGIYLSYAAAFLIPLVVAYGVILLIRLKYAAYPQDLMLSFSLVLSFVFIVYGFYDWLHETTQNYIIVYSISLGIPFIREWGYKKIYNRVFKDRINYASLENVVTTKGRGISQFHIDDDEESNHECNEEEEGSQSD